MIDILEISDPGDDDMCSTASLSFPEMISLMEKLPAYRDYTSAFDAAAREREFRLALGLMLKECGDHLLNVAEKKSQILNGEMQQTIDNLVDRIGAILCRLDREGRVCLVGDHAATIAELEELDVRLMLLVEEAVNLVRNLETEVPAAAWFQTDAGRLSHDLAAFIEMAEERNFLLGLGWESEFTWR